MQIIIDPNTPYNVQKQRVQYAWSCIKEMLKGGVVLLEIGVESKSRQVERKYHALINDIAKTVRLDQQYSTESWKALLVDAFQVELRSQGIELRHPGRMEMSFDNQRIVSIRPSTTKFTKKEGSMFIEFLYAWGTERGATFNEKSLAYYDEVMK
jgi:hypothetical protein